MVNLDAYKKKFRDCNLDDSLVDYLYKYLNEENRLLEFDRGIDLLLSGKPIQYVIGNVDFFGNKIIVNDSVLIPRFETELLVDKSIKYIKRLFNNSMINILDIGTGSGCIAISMKKMIDCNVSACDISLNALEVARKNASINNVDINFFVSDMLGNVNDTYDVIISNPPYISYDEEIMDIVRLNEPNIALFAIDNGLFYYREILSNCSKVLKEKFLICFEIGCKQGNDISNMVSKYFSDVNVSIEKDYSNRDRFLFIWK